MSFDQQNKCGVWKCLGAIVLGAVVAGALFLLIFMAIEKNIFHYYGHKEAVHEFNQVRDRIQAQEKRFEESLLKKEPQYYSTQKQIEKEQQAHYQELDKL